MDKITEDKVIDVEDKKWGLSEWLIFIGIVIVVMSLVALLVKAFIWSATLGFVLLCAIGVCIAWAGMDVGDQL
ncbi:MAG: hypothetical protein Q8910_04270 [Bacteroidota bacterium]|nr:hypothetical protein [Bacteroidota bacterium]